jgi:surface protein
MTFMFDGASTFNQELSGWITSRVTNMFAMFQGASSFNKDISTWNTGSVFSFTLTFDGASSFNQDISSWNTGRALFMTWMFAGASDFNQDLSLWDVSRVVDMSSMFEDATSFDQLLCWDLTSKDDTFDVDSMFCGSQGNFDPSCVSQQFIADSRLECSLSPSGARRTPLLLLSTLVSLLVVAFL